MSYKLIEKLNPDFVRLERPDGIKQLWSAVTVRNTGTPRSCAKCLKPIIPGTRAFSPLGNPDNRFKRIHVECVKS